MSFNPPDKLFIIRIEHSQTDHEWIGAWGKSYYAAEHKVKQKYPDCYYYSCAARVDKILE